MNTRATRQLSRSLTTVRLLVNSPFSKTAPRCESCTLIYIQTQGKPTQLSFRWFVNFSRQWPQRQAGKQLQFSAGTRTRNSGKFEATEVALQKMLRMAAGRGAASTAGGEHGLHANCASLMLLVIHFHGHVNILNKQRATVRAERKPPQQGQ